MEVQPVPVLFFLMEFAPVNTTGQFRNTKLIKYISQFNIKPIVITFVEEEAASIFNTKIDTKLLEELPNDTKIYRIPITINHPKQFKRLREFISIYFSIREKLAEKWMPNVKKEIGNIIKHEKPMCIYTSIPPFSSGYLANTIAKKFHLPYILDMRDLWANFGLTPFNTKWHYIASLAAERKIIQSASKVIVVTPQMKSVLEKTHESNFENKITVIPNGYDFEVNEVFNFSFIPKNEKIVIGYVGAFYFNQQSHQEMLLPWYKKRSYKKLQYIHQKIDWLYRTPFFFLQAIKKLFILNPNLQSKIEIQFIGHEAEWLKNMIAELGLESNFKHHGFVSYQESNLLQNNFDFYLATAEKYTGGEHFCLPSKVFDMVGKQKPILGFVTEGIQKEFIEKSNLGVVLNPDEIENNTLYLNNIFCNGLTVQPDYTYIKHYHRKAIAEKIAKTIIENLN
jgi:glycosyltransferase involved in cell wall biosynthesis